MKKRLYRLTKEGMKEVWMDGNEAVPLIEYTHVPGTDMNENLEGMHTNRKTSDIWNVFETILIDADYYDSLEVLAKVSEEKHKEIFDKLSNNITEAHELCLRLYDYQLNQTLEE